MPVASGPFTGLHGGASGKTLSFARRAARRVRHPNGLSRANQFCYARRRNNRTSTRRRTARIVALDASGRVRARRDGAHPRRQTWCALTGTGDRDRFVESAPCRRKAAGAQTRQSAHETAGEARPGKGPERTPPKTLAHPIAGCARRAQTRKPAVGFEKSIIAPGETRRPTPLSRRALGRGEESGPRAETGTSLSPGQDRQREGAVSIPLNKTAVTR